MFDLSRDKKSLNNTGLSHFERDSECLNPDYFSIDEMDLDKETLLKHFKLSDFKKIYEFDLMSRYYGAIPNDIFRIERYNTTSGKGIDYRVVIPGKYDQMF